MRSLLSIFIPAINDKLMSEFRVARNWTALLWTSDGGAGLRRMAPR